MDELEYYRTHSAATDPGAHRNLLDDRPADPAALAKLVGGLIVHRDWTWRFGFTLPEHRRDEANTRTVSAMLDRLGSLDERQPSERLAGTCRDFTVLLVALLRAAGVPARARAGFAGYFTEGFYDDHWVVETWSAATSSWHLVDAQVAGAPPGTYNTAAGLDPLDVPRDAFLVGGQAWRDCRTGAHDPSTFGVAVAGLTGMWEIQGNVLRDLAALNRAETLPWDNWGLIPVHYDELPHADLDLLDRVAAVSAAGGPLPVSEAAYASDPRIPAPSSAP
ncbi:transglutaminase-like domain-containing protein [Dactylosporangium darangshiense]|uniref:Transglutaminase-like domain-containing protein n=2 Tax=Dactylosporangium darangshiense TaxID=579108 RepID=A0ABP8DKN0_9ACTN